MLRVTLSSFLNLFAKHQVESRCKVSIGAGSRVDFRKLSAKPPAVLNVGIKTLCHARIMADRPEAKITIGSRTFIGNSMIVSAESVHIGDDVLISWGCTIVDHDSHALDFEGRKGDVTLWAEGKKDWAKVKIVPVRIEDRAWIGFNSIILKGVQIGRGSVVAAGSVVTRDVAPFTVVGGNPARLIKELPHE